MALMPERGHRASPRALARALYWIGLGALNTCFAVSTPDWPDTPLTRLEALALIQTLNAEILASRSATSSLEQWCQAHHLAAKPVIVARRIDPLPEPASPAQRAALEVGAHDLLRYRRVELSCGDHVLSIADNWYVPGRLTAGMNRQLEGTQTPFGIVVQPLHPHRETLEVKLLWSPLPEGWESNGAGALAPRGAHLDLPAALFEHRAILYTAQHQPIAEVHEIYQRDLLAFPEPQLHQNGD
jgi:hypothetical protein